ncbi:hypothetical protein JX265_012668 [Neoarthrinium moseri]|uniref:MINDY deubiquitinase domain-containing protein n=1 Tax=Neoarthrinium moseri TaxID=1658444 RepID=A0A9P9WA32_9PEZI|nr:hypothetical protein JX265_012668 [Neoarthrinium moseri]
MVTRKSVPENAPINPSAPPAISVEGVRQELWSPTDSDTDGEKIWGGAGANQQTRGSPAPGVQDVPSPLRPGTAGKSPFGEEEENPWGDASADGGKSKVTLEHTPTVLRPGGKLETNPFKRKPVNRSPSPQAAQGSRASSNPSPTPPTEAFSELRVADSEQNTNPWKPAIEVQDSGQGPSVAVPVSHPNDAEPDIWGTAPAHPPPSQSTPKPPLVSLPLDGESPAWDEFSQVNGPKPSLPSMPQKSDEEQEFSQDAHAWDDLGALDKGKGPAAAVAQPPAQGTSNDEWNLIDHEPAPAPPSLSRQSTWENFVDAQDEPKAQQTNAPPVTQHAAPEEASDEPPTLPPRQSLEVPPSQPPQPNTPSAANKTETYQIKNINWYDASTGQNPRRSPILVQNANGPCPLVALVNALTLTTPADLTNTVLVETLRSREQISLTLLLEAVFDELMSPRRTKSDASLPDVTELYAFLKGLHTGMNVNPRYVPTPELITAHKRTSLTHVHPSERGDYIPGTFEDTRDMKLYATFSVPLIHGWLPPKDDPAYEAFNRQASSYDEAQNLMFREEELEDKLSNSDTGLTEQEQQMYRDILTIKSWLNVSATQLTPWGLEVVTKAIPPGTFSILFRNDHFSTLYRHPQTLQLFTLVTDAGYYTHDEIVWESLVDVNGERTEFLSGDFRLVGGPQHGQSQSTPRSWYADGESSNAQGGEWQTVQSRRGGRNQSSQSEPPASPMSANHEQEDRDLALALQLQEEEDERHRSEQEARRRESQLSEQFIEQQGRGGTARTGPSTRGRGASRGGMGSARGSSTSVNIPVRGASNAARGGARPVTQHVRPLVPPAASTTHRPGNNEEDDAPPSYEQASKATPYNPPAGHPNHPSSTPGSASTARRRPTLPSVTPSSSGQAGPGTPVGRGRPVPVAQNSMSGGQRDRDCAVM